jgi:predicted cupin superfamily sugar epimerase
MCQVFGVGVIMTAEHWIETLGLVPHPEGGWYREVYRSHELIAEDALPERFGGPRVFSTAIYFLLTAGEVSRLHRIRQDELWHFYDGDPLRLHRLDRVGDHHEQLVGRSAEAPPFAVVPAGDYFGAEVCGEGFSLVGCTVAPGFDFQDFEMPSRDELYQEFSQHAELIQRLT